MIEEAIWKKIITKSYKTFKNVLWLRKYYHMYQIKFLKSNKLHS